MGTRSTTPITAAMVFFFAASAHYDVMILDRLLPGGVDGLGIVEVLRKTENKTPILILSALAEVDDRIRGLRSGGDDYLTKPFAFGELLARLEALVRRSEGVGIQTALTVADLRIDLLSHQVTRAGRPIQLQRQEFRLLEYLARHADQVVTRTMLLENVWEHHFDPQTNVIDALVEGTLHRSIGERTGQWGEAIAEGQRSLFGGSGCLTVD